MWVRTSEELCEGEGKLLGWLHKHPHSRSFFSLSAISLSVSIFGNDVFTHTNRQEEQEKIRLPVNHIKKRLLLLLLLLVHMYVCTVLRCVAVCCSVLQCVALCCSVLQRVVVCAS